MTDAPQPAATRLQLRMRRPHLDHLPPVTVPAGYTLRTYRPGDERAWGQIMESPGGIGQDWTEAKVLERLIQQPPFEPAGLFFVTSDTEGGRPVASACAWRGGLDRDYVPILHMVAAMEAHRGRGLGRLVCLAVLHYCRERGDPFIELGTDDFRLAAIKSYLGMGFVPVYREDAGRHDDHRLRWSAVFQTLLAPLAARPAP